MRKFWLLMLILYVGGYLAIRQAFAEKISTNSNEVYVRFPTGTDVLYYLWWPLSSIDRELTGTDTAAPGFAIISHDEKT
jgi:hypothetical protein